MPEMTDAEDMPWNRHTQAKCHGKQREQDQFIQHNLISSRRSQFMQPY